MTTDRAESDSGVEQTRPGIGDVYGPLYPGNVYYGDRKLVPTNYGNVRLNSETTRRFWNGADQEIIGGHWEARCPCCYEEHVVEGTTDEERVELWNRVLDCCDEVRWLAPSDYLDPCSVCGRSHREQHECTAPGYRNPFPSPDEHRFDCAECEWAGDGDELDGPAGECPECGTPSVSAIPIATDGGVEDAEGVQRTECWRCGYQRPTFESCPECGGSCKPLTKQEQMAGDDRAIYLAGPVEKDDDPRSWRDEIKLRFPHVDFIDPMDFQEDWDEDPVGVIERELEVCESHPILVCNIGSEAPETIGTHHEISHALAHGNDKIAVVPDGEVSGFVEHRVPTYDSAETAVSALVDGPVANEEKELVTDGGVEDSNNDSQEGQGTKYTIPDGHWDESDLEEENDAHPTEYIKSHTIDIYVDDEPDPDDNYGRTKFTAHVSYRDGEPWVLYFTEHTWKGNFWRDILDLDWQDVPDEVKRRVAAVIDCDGVESLDPEFRTIEEGGRSRWEKIHMPRIEASRKHDDTEEEYIKPKDIQAFVDDLRHNSERRSFVSVDTDTLDTIADELEGVFGR